MKVLTIAASKGGSGKSSLCTSLAVRAARDSQKVALLDLEPQGSLTHWWERRREPESPHLFRDPGRLRSDIQLLRQDGWSWVLIDTPPALMKVIEDSIAVADLVLIPVRASAFDLAAIDPVLDMCRARRRKFAFVVNAAEPDWKLTEKAAKALRDDGRVLGNMITYRQSYISALTAGKTGAEIDRTARKEIDALWAEVCELLGVSSGAKL